MINIFSAVGLFAFGAFVGWVGAHYQVADECKQLGGFFVGSETFKCHKVEQRETE
ncbi:hypothetical protein CZ787_14240 [Halomonas citrativorans]|uniref:Uncharacterized protein n=1 Tax=Halomonas citrativorans TaxID=2742612 RepID=A0A1R4I321_9GAMM|nr:hypothetical protein CZ787_14240 [Halomonas citrativorans]